MTSIARIVAPSQAGFNVHRIREDFPALHQTVHGKPLVYSGQRCDDAEASCGA